MSLNRNMKQQGKNSTEASFRKPSPKRTGTRVGILEDWRQGGTKSGRISGGAGKTLRDGR